jgi:hypothetical protein
VLRYNQQVESDTIKTYFKSLLRIRSEPSITYSSEDESPCYLTQSIKPDSKKMQSEQLKRDLIKLEHLFPAQAEDHGFGLETRSQGEISPIVAAVYEDIASCLLSPTNGPETAISF